MAVVPSNTISDPVRVRRPDVRMAQPGTAQAMGAITSALSNRARSIGGLADAAGQTAASLERRGDMQARADLFEAQGRGIAYQGMAELGNQVAEGTIRIDRIMQRRAEEEAQNALTDFTSHMSTITQGHNDPVTNELVAGTYETPYSPGNSQDESNGPMLSTAREMKKWLEDGSGSYAKLSPRAREVFDKNAGRVQSDFMMRAGRAQFQQMQEFREKKDAMALTADREMLRGLAGDNTPEGNRHWLTSMKMTTDAQIMREMGMHYSGDKDQPIDPSKWDSSEVADYVSDRSEFLMKTFVTDKVGVLLTVAQAEENDTRRELLLRNAEEYVAIKKPGGASGETLLSQDVIAKTKIETARVRSAAISKQAQRVKDASDTASTLSLQALIEPTPENMNKAKEALSNPYLTDVDRQKIELNVRNDEEHLQTGLFRHALAQGPLEAARFKATMTSPAAIAEANRIENEVETASVKLAKESQRLDVESAIVSGGRLVRDPATGKVSPVKMDPWSLRQLNMEAWRSGALTLDQFKANNSEIMRKAPDEDVLVTETLQAIEDIAGVDIIDDAIKLQDGVVLFNEKAKGVFQHKGIVGKSMSASYDGQPVQIFNKAGEPGKVIEDPIRNIKLSSEAVTSMVDYVLKYYRANINPDKPMSPRQLVENSFRPRDKEGLPVPVPVDRWRNYDLERNSDMQQGYLSRLEAQFQEQFYTTSGE